MLKYSLLASVLLIAACDAWDKREIVSCEDIPCVLSQFTVEEIKGALWTVGLCYHYVHERCFAYHDCNIEELPFECIDRLLESECIYKVHDLNKLNDCASYYNVISCDTLSENENCSTYY